MLTDKSSRKFILFSEWTDDRLSMKLVGRRGRDPTWNGCNTLNNGRVKGRTSSSNAASASSSHRWKCRRLELLKRLRLRMKKKTHKEKKESNAVRTEALACGLGKGSLVEIQQKKQGLTFVFNTKEKAPMSSTQIKFGHGRKNPLDLDSFQGFLACHGILFIN